MRAMLKWASRLFNQGCLAAPQGAVSHWHRERTARKVGVNRREGDGGQGQRTFLWTWAETKKWKGSFRRCCFSFLRGGRGSGLTCRLRRNRSGESGELMEQVPEESEEDEPSPQGRAPSREGTSIPEAGGKVAEDPEKLSGRK